MKALYRTHATAIGGRDGCAASADRKLRVDFSKPRELDGTVGPGTSPEQLFALGYAASLLSAIREAADRKQVALTQDSNVTATVAVGQEDEGHGLALEVAINADLPGVDETTADRLVAEALELCPFSKAMRSNIAMRCSVG